MVRDTEEGAFKREMGDSTARDSSGEGHPGQDPEYAKPEETHGTKTRSLGNR